MLAATCEFSLSCLTSGTGVGSVGAAVGAGVAVEGAGIPVEVVVPPTVPKVVG